MNPHPLLALLEIGTAAIGVTRRHQAGELNEADARARMATLGPWLQKTSELWALVFPRPPRREDPPA